MWRRREKTGTALYDESGCNMDMTRRSPGCGRRRCKWLDGWFTGRKH